MKGLRIMLAVLAAATLPQSSASACSCIVQPASTYLQRAAVAFTGEARSVEAQRGGLLVATFSVSRVHKGDVGSEATVFTGVDAGDCGIAFTEGDTYTVFATMRAETLLADLCSGTAEGDTFAAAPGAASSPEATREAVSDSVPVAAGTVPSRPVPSRTVPLALGAALPCLVLVGILRRVSAL